MSMFIGEALCGEGNEIAHIDLLIGDKSGPVGVAFANALSNQSMGHSNLLAVLAPNLAVKPATVMITKVTIKGAKQAVQMFGPAQYAVAKAVADSVEANVIPKEQAENVVIVCGVFIHWGAADDKKIFEYNYEATKLAISRAMTGKPDANEVEMKKKDAKHAFAGKWLTDPEGYAAEQDAALAAAQSNKPADGESAGVPIEEQVGDVQA